jgi:phosphoribosylformimino-5-aminoimidazole carboxamide ribotide isomerase
MIIIPAIDLKDGKCVRLKQGRMDSSTVFNDDPAAQARLWEESGAARIHVVDLDGSVGGKPVNLERVQQIVKAVRVPVQLGGGVRTESVIRMYLDIGVDAVILGTMAARDPERVLELLETFPGRISIGIDARGGKVAVEGWTESTDVPAVALAARFDGARPASFIYTDIERDGMMRGPNAAATAEFARSVTTPVVLSGGVTRMQDLETIIPLEKDGVTGIIIGRALYEGSINLREAVRLVEGRNAR